MITEYLVSLVGLAGLLAAAALGFAHVVKQVGRAGAASAIAAAIALAVNVVGLGALHVTQGLLPSMRQSFASSITLATLITLVALGSRRTPTLRGLDWLLLFLAALVQFASVFQIGAPTVAVTYKPWFISHQVAFVLGATCFAASGAAGAAYLVITALLRRKRRLVLLGQVAPLESLERFGRWTLVLGFPPLTYGVLTGFCYLLRQTNPGPAVWIRDPFIVVTLILWACYAVAVLAVWFLPRMRGRRGATLATAGLVLLVIVFLVMGHISTLHR